MTTPPQFQPYTPAWDVPMPEGVDRRPLEWYLDRSRRIAAERERAVVDEAEAVLVAALDTPPAVPRQRTRDGARRSGGGAEHRPG